MTGLNKKVNKTELEELLKSKVESFEILKLSAKIDGKIEKTVVDTHISDINQKLNKNCENIEFLIEKNYSDSISEIEEKFVEFQKNVKSELENIRKSINLMNSKKADFNEIENICENIKQKADFEETMHLFDKFNKEYKQTLTDIRKEIRGESKKYTFSTDFAYKVNEDITKLRNSMIEVLEDRKKDTIDHASFLKNATFQIKKEIKDDLIKIGHKIEEVSDNVSENYTKKQEFAIYKQDLKKFSEQKLNKTDFQEFLSTKTDPATSFQNLKDYVKSKLKKFSSKIEKILITKEKT